MKKQQSLMTKTRKVTFFMLFCLMAMMYATSAQAQKVTLPGQTKTVQEVMSEIEQQTGYKFFYNNTKIDLSRHVTIKAKKSELSNVLNQLFAGTSVDYKVMDKNIVLTVETAPKQQSQSETNAPKRKVTGRITDAKGEPIIGASVKERGTSNGAVTDIDGNFTLNISGNANLEVSYIGFATQNIPVKNNSTLNITMKEDQRSLDEVIVVGYGSVKKSNLTSSVSKITDEALKDRPVSNVTEAIQGQLAGVSAQATGGGIPGEELTIRIRGVNTINGNSSPLYVIDGVPRDNMSDINPSDISSMQILKDASATSIYGSRGANGVVLIETKKGAGKPTVTFEAYYGLQTAEKKLDLMSGEEWVAYNMWYRNASYLRSGGSMSDPMSSRPIAYRIPSWWSTFTDFTDWQSEVLRTAPIQSYETSASASGDMGNIYMSLGYLDQNGIVKYTGYHRYNMRVNGTLNIMKNLKIGANFSYSNSAQNAAATNLGDRNGKDGPLHHALMMSPLISPGMTVRTAANGYAGTPASTESSADYGAWWIDPLAQMQQTLDKTRNDRVQTSVWGEWNILPSLTYKIQFSNNYDGIGYEYFQPASVNRSSYKSAGSSYTTRTNDWVLQNTLTFDQQFGQHHLNVLLGQSAEKQRYYIANLEASGWPYESVTTLNMASTPVTATTQRTTYANASFFGRASYDYMEKYLLTASVRRDGSSRFGNNTKWGTFPSFSAGWKINEENFMKNVNWINLLKLRVSYGTSGNDRIGDYAYVAQLGTYYSAYGENKQGGAAASNIANQDLKWEQTGSLDFGFDFSAFHNRLQFNFDYYSNTTKNLLFNLPIPYTTGFESTLTNIGKIRNQGWEVDVTSHNLDGLFKWTSSLNLSHNSNKVLEMGGGTTQIITALHGSYQFITKVGGPVSQFYDYEYQGYLTAADITNGVPIAAGEEEGNSKIKDQNGDGKITDADRVPCGTNLPDLTWGLTNRFAYKNFELSVLLQGQFGGKIMFVGSRHIDCGYGDRTSYARWVRCYKTDLLKEAIPTEYCEAHGIDMSWDGETQNQFNWAPQDNIYKATYMRIKNITLSYTFPKSLLSKTRLSAVKIYGSIDNVYTFSDYPGYTPETSTYGNGTTQLGVDYSTYPLSRRYTLGVNVTF
jgi:TonB-linked SusC/RagA family outer membrane protein